MGRPKSADPKEAVTLRLPASALARWEALGEGWRAAAEALLVAHVAPKAKVTNSAPEPGKKPFVSRLKGEWKAP